MVTPQDESTQFNVILPAYAALEALEKGFLDMDGFINLNEMNATAYCLALHIHKNGSEAVKADMLSREHIPTEAAEALNGVATRYNEKGKFGATGEEIKAIRKAIVMLDELLMAAPKGVSLKAMMQAAKMVDESLALMKR